MTVHELVLVTVNGVYVDLFMVTEKQHKWKLRSHSMYLIDGYPTYPWNVLYPSWDVGAKYRAMGHNVSPNIVNAVIGGRGIGKLWRGEI